MAKTPFKMGYFGLKKGPIFDPFFDQVWSIFGPLFDPLLSGPGQDRQIYGATDAILGPDLPRTAQKGDPFLTHFWLKNGSKMAQKGVFLTRF